MENSILFSIVIPTYNRAPFIKRTIESFLSQSYSNYEIIIVDDGSNDNTEDIVNAISDDRVHYYKKNNEERGAARNFGLKLAKGNYINFFDSDDLAYPNHLAIAIKTIEKNSLPEIFHLGHDLKTPTGELLETCNSFDGNTEVYAIRKKKISINALFVKREVALGLPFSINRLLSASEDALYLCQLCARYTLYYDNTITSTIVEHDTRSMVTASEHQLLNRRKYLIEGLQKDALFMEKYATTIAHIRAEMSYLLCLSCLASHENIKAYKYFKESLKGSSMTLFNKRTLVFINKAIINFIKY